MRRAVTSSKVRSPRSGSKTASRATRSGVDATGVARRFSAASETAVPSGALTGSGPPVLRGVTERRVPTSRGLFRRGRRLGVLCLGGHIARQHVVHWLGKRRSRQWMLPLPTPGRGRRTRAPSHHGRCTSAGCSSTPRRPGALPTPCEWLLRRGVEMRASDFAHPFLELGRSQPSARLEQHLHVDQSGVPFNGTQRGIGRHAAQVDERSGGGGDLRPVLLALDD